MSLPGGVRASIYTCPWGVWTLYKGTLETEQVDTLSIEEANNAYILRPNSLQIAYSPRNCSNGDNTRLKPYVNS